MTALVRHDTLDNAVNEITEPEAAKTRFPAPCYVHHVPGRLRLKVAEFREDPVILERACHEFAGLPGVLRVCPNTLTGSILVEYDTRVSPPDELLEAMQQRGFPRIPLEKPANLGDAEQTSLTECLIGAAARSLFDWLVERLVFLVIAAVI